MVRNNMDYVKLSKEISYALRHAPWEYELEMDEDGFVLIEQLLSEINLSNEYGKKITKDDLLNINSNSEKKRWEIVDDKIRALYGHSFPLKIRKATGTPPDILYHGTSHKAINEILTNGLLPMSRQYVHMSTTVDMAITVGKRRDNNPIILKINARKAFADGLKFYVGNEYVWLCDFVPPKYIEIVEIK